MGRPIHKKYFGNTNVGSASTRTDDGIGGEGVATVNISNSGTLYSAGAVALFTAPQLPGGVRATASVSLNSAGSVALAITEAGSGYTSAPTVSITTASSVSTAATGTISQTVIYVTTATGIYAGMKANGTGINAGATYVASVVGNTVNLTAANAAAVTVANYISFQDVGSGFADTTTLATAKQNAIQFSAWTPYASNGTLNTGGSAVAGDIVKQQGTRRYYVKTAQGYGVCGLTTGTIARGEMTVAATDWNGNTYKVSRLESKKARVWQDTQNGSSAWVYANNDLAKWTLAAATGTDKTVVTTTISISNT